MKSKLNAKLVEFLSAFNNPVYLVGGCVRDFLMDKTAPFNDVDVAAAISTDDFLDKLNQFGGEAVAHYKRTHTVVFKLGGQKCEFTSFRKEIYKRGGTHTPESTVLTDNIVDDAERRDFKCNAIYYDVKGDKFVDPLGGISDIKNRVLDTVIIPERVFEHDGLRLMRLARFTGELGFTPTEKVVERARACADNIDDISCERVLAELELILQADSKHTFSPSNGHYLALKMLDKIGVLDKILPELTLGRNMEQRADFHSYDVLEHSLRAVKYAHKSIRLAALLHDVGKPYCKINFGKYHGHDAVGERIVVDILKRLKASEKTMREVKFLVGKHMLDMDGKMGETKLRRLFVENYDLLDKLIELKKADHRACKDQLNEPETVVKWLKLIEKMKSDGTPFNLSSLNIKAQDLIDIGARGKEIGATLKYLFDMTVINPVLNEKTKLLSIAKRKILC